METKTAKKSSGVVEDFAPQPWGNGAPEKWAAVTVKITVLGRDRGNLGVSEEGGKWVCNVAKVPCVPSGP